MRKIMPRLRGASRCSRAPLKPWANVENYGLIVNSLFIGNTVSRCKRFLFCFTPQQQQQHDGQGFDDAIRESSFPSRSAG
jgi:hypothetical protein